MSVLTSLTLLDAAEGLKSKKFSSLELTEAHLNRIKDCDKELNAYITVCEENAILSAKESDRRRSRGEEISPLDGVPFAVKDNISTVGVLTSCASRMLENYIPPYSATAAERLCGNGAVMLGKTNLDEFAMGVSTETSFFGVTKNPIDPSFVAGGSSGGSAAAVMSGEAVFSLGSDTGGSVRQPAAFCGAVGMRPTYGTVSRYGLISFAPSLDIIGPITKTVRDNAMVLNLLCGKDIKDETSVSHPFGDLARDIEEFPSSLRVAVLDGIEHNCSPQLLSAMESTEKALAALGAQIRHITPSLAKNAYAAYYIIACAEASSNLARFDGVRYGRRAESFDSIQELYISSRSEGFGEEVKRRLLFGTLALSSEYAKDLYLSACNMRHAITAELEELLRDTDIILLPTAPTSAYRIGEALSMGFDSGIDDIFCTLAALSGMPALSLPVQTDTMPVGIQLMGKKFSEPLLYRTAYMLEKNNRGDHGQIQ